MHNLVARLTVCVAVVVWVTCAPAWALDAKKGALNLARSAAAAYEAGDMARAAQLYLEAYRNDSGESTYLYGAARAEQAAGQFDRAEQHFRQFVALKTADSDRVNRAISSLDELAGMRSDQKAEAAERFARRGEWPLAVAAYREAFRLRPDRTFLLYRAAVASREGGDKAQAVDFLKTYLQKAAPDAPDRPEAKLLIESLENRAGQPAKTEEPPKPVEPARPAEAKVTAPVPVAAKPAEAPPAPSVGVVAPAPRPDPGMSGRQMIAWSTLGTGGLVAVVGAVLLGVGKAQESTFNEKLAYDGTTVHGNVDYDAATAEASAISGRQTAGVVMLGVGALAAGAGAVLLLTSPDPKVSVATDGKTLLVGWRF